MSRWWSSSGWVLVFDQPMKTYGQGALKMRSAFLPSLRQSVTRSAPVDDHAGGWRSLEADRTFGSSARLHDDTLPVDPVVDHHRVAGQDDLRRCGDGPKLLLLRHVG